MVLRWQELPVEVNHRSWMKTMPQIRALDIVREFVGRWSSNNEMDVANRHWMALSQRASAEEFTLLECNAEVDAKWTAESQVSAMIVLLHTGGERPKVRASHSDSVNAAAMLWTRVLHMILS